MGFNDDEVIEEHYESLHTGSSENLVFDIDQLINSK